VKPLLLLSIAVALFAQTQPIQSSKCARIEGDTIIQFCPDMKIIVVRDGVDDGTTISNQVQYNGPGKVQGDSDLTFGQSKDIPVGETAHTDFVSADGKVIWTQQQFKDYCGRLEPCEAPPDVEVREDPDPDADAQLEARIKKLEETVRNLEADIQMLRQRMAAVDNKPVWQ
jgi:hypothetical protein